MTRLAGNMNAEMVLVAAADAFNGNPSSTFVDASGYSALAFLVLIDGTTGTTTGRATIVVQEADDAAGTGAAAIAAEALNPEGKALDSGVLTAITTSGFSPAANAENLVLIEVDPRALSKRYVGLSFTEDVNDPVTAGAVAIGLGSRYKGDTVTAL